MTRSLTLTESRARAGLLTVREYDVHLDLTASEEFGSRTVVTFDCTTSGASTFLDLADALSVRATLNGAALPESAYDDGRLTLTDLHVENELVVDARLPYVTTGDGMHTFTDPVDDERYVSAYCGMDIARFVFACFDQPDLKAPIRLSVDADPDWTVLGNGRGRQSEPGRWSFDATPPLSTYLFVVCAGPWHSVTFEHAGLPFGWHARRSLAAELDRDAEELRRITTACFEHYTRVFTEPYPFDSYDQVFVPGQNWGALETPGCVTFRDEYLFRDAPTAMRRQARATVIAHEMAHMWFGDLVTMRWWEDSWLNESFADYMGYQVAGEAAGYADSWISCAIGRKSTGYRADERRSTHPVAEDTEAMVDVDTAFGNFDMITYAKGNAVLRQLVAWLGEETFLAGVNAYLTRHRFGNADLADFLAALDSVSERDVRGWADAWLRRSGFDTLHVERDGDTPVVRRAGTRQHRLTVTGFDGDANPVTETVDVAADPVALPDLTDRAVVLNSGDETFARIRLDEVGWRFVEERLSEIPDPLTRAVLWSTAVDLVRTGDLTATAFLGLTARHLPAEPHPMVFEGALDATLGQVLPLLDPDLVEEAHRRLASACAEVADPDRALAAAQGLARTTRDAALLERWLAEGTTGTGEPVRGDLRWQVVRRLVALGADPRLVDTELERDPTAAGRLGARTARAAVPTAEAKAATWTEVWDPSLSNREFEAASAGFWTPGQHELVGGYLTDYLDRAPDVARRRGQAFAATVGSAFPRLPLPLSRLRELRDDLATRLAGDAVPTVLRRKWDDALDDLDVVLRVRQA